MTVGTTYSGRRVHRAWRSKFHWHSDCGVALGRVHQAETVVEAGAFWPLCEKCFTPDERHRVLLAHMEAS